MRGSRSQAHLIGDDQSLLCAQLDTRRRGQQKQELSLRAPRIRVQGLMAAAIRGQTVSEHACRAKSCSELVRIRLGGPALDQYAATDSCYATGCCSRCSLLRNSVRDRCGSAPWHRTFCRGGGRLDRVVQEWRREVLLGGHGCLSAPVRSREITERQRIAAASHPRLASDADVARCRALSSTRYACTRSDPMIAGVSCRSDALRAFVQVGGTDPSRLCLAGALRHVGQGRDAFRICFYLL